MAAWSKRARDGHQSSFSLTGRTVLELTYPQVPQAACGSFGLPHFGQALSVIERKA